MIRPQIFLNLCNVVRINSKLRSRAISRPSPGQLTHYLPLAIITNYGRDMITQLLGIRKTRGYVSTAAGNHPVEISQCGGDEE